MHTYAYVKKKFPIIIVYGGSNLKLKKGAARASTISTKAKLLNFIKKVIYSLMDVPRIPQVSAH